jgi:hypothetical protein
VIADYLNPAAMLYTHDGGDPEWVIPELCEAYRRLVAPAADVFGRPTTYESWKADRPGYLASSLCSVGPRNYQPILDGRIDDLNFAYLIVPADQRRGWSAYLAGDNCLFRKLIQPDQSAEPLSIPNQTDYPYLGEPAASASGVGWYAKIDGAGGCDDRPIYYGSFVDEATANAALRVKLAQRGGVGRLVWVTGTIASETEPIAAEEVVDGRRSASPS